MKFSIVTPSYNSQRFIRETVESVINQKGDFEIEYLIVDNFSTDQTKQIVNEYLDLLASGEFPIKCNGVKMKFVSDSDASMYEAIQKGFAQATGDIYAWINSDDIYLPGAFDIIQRTFSKFPQIQWLKGITSYINENSNIFTAGRCNLYQQDWIIQGVYGPLMHFIQQDSVFWRPALWEKSGGIDSKYKVAGDYALWRKFAQYEPLYSIYALVSCFRKVSGQKSEDPKKYWEEAFRLGTIDKLKHSLFKYFLFFNKYMPGYINHYFSLMFHRNDIYHLIMINNNSIELQSGKLSKLQKLLQ